jgi:hypothetical protein
MVEVSFPIQNAKAFNVGKLRNALIKNFIQALLAKVVLAKKAAPVLKNCARTREREPRNLQAEQ